MGVRGLTTFIKKQEKRYLKNYKLHNCTVLLDGNSVASNLFIWSNIESAFGGDYDKFAKYVKEFFKVLKKCEISPLVVFDGGYEGRKLKTVYSRMKEKFKSARNAQPLTGSLNFPLFMRIVFREVLIELNIPFAQSDFEADDELAALARQLRCPVLSYDSDFYIYDVFYIPFPSLSLEPIAFRNLGVNESSRPTYYLDCKIYSVDVLIESFGGLDKNMLPLLAALLGNDYIKRSVFKAFYANLKIPKGKTSPLQRRIKAVMDWLRNETFESATRKILGRMKKKSRKHVMRQLRKTVNGYIQYTSILSDHLAISLDCNATNSSGDNQTVMTKMDPHIVQVIDAIDENIETIGDNIVDSDENPAVIYDSSSSESECEHSEVDISAGEDVTKNENHSLGYKIGVEPDDSEVISPWLLNYARKGKIQSCVVDILSLKQYFFPPQVEDYSLPSSHFISLQILSVIVGVLLGKSESLVKYWTRDGSHLEWYTIDPICETDCLKFPSYSTILEVSESKRRNALLEAIEISIDLTVLPEEWHLFVIAILFWLKNMTQPVATEGHLHTMVMCLVAIFAIDSQIGVHRNKQSFTRKYKNFLRKVTESKIEENIALKESNKLTESLSSNESKTFTPKVLFANISHAECVLIFETILPYYHLNEQIKAKPKQFCISTVHGFAQFQSCLFHLMVLNSVLGFPFKEPCVSRLYSGTFVYNIYTKLSKCNNINNYVETMFQTFPSLLNLYMSLINVLENSLIGVDLHKKVVKQHKKKKKQTQEKKIVDTLNEDGSEEDGEVYIDENNKFSGLSLNV